MLSSKDIKELRDIFKAIDTNGDGKLDREELLKHYSELLGAELAESEVDRIMKQVDTDHNGSIEYTEFINATIDQKKFMTKSNLFKAFKLFDRDDSGKISAQELKRILEGGGESNDEVWNSIISAVDKNGDGEIDFEEFEAIVLENSN